MNEHEEALFFCRFFNDRGMPTMLVGGCVRDLTMGVKPRDYDLATTALPAQGLALLAEAGYRVLPTGLRHGTISLVTQLQEIQITTLRQDVQCFGRTAQVAFTNHFEEDARRRDFTINALYQDVNGQIIDFCGGLEDIRLRRLRFVGDPHQRIREDYLRSLRYFRFLARFGWTPIPAQIAAITAESAGLSQLSAERIHAEIEKTLTAPFLVQVLKPMAESGLLTQLFPWFRATAMDALICLLKTIALHDRLLLWFVFLFHGGRDLSVQGLTEELRRQRFPRWETKVLGQLWALFCEPEEVEKKLHHLLRLCARNTINLAELKLLIERLPTSWESPISLVLGKLIDGMSRLPEVPIPRDVLMALPERERGPAVDLIKISWYLGMCDDRSRLADVILHREKFLEELRTGAFDMRK